MFATRVLFFRIGYRILFAESNQNCLSGDKMFFPLNTLLFILVLVCPSIMAKDSKSTFTEADKGRKAVIALHSKFSVSLRGNPSTGYDWQPASIDSSKIVPTTNSTFTPDTTGLVGAAGRCRIEFTAVGLGKSTLKMKYCRSWEPGLPVDSFNIIIVVKKQH